MATTTKNRRRIQRHPVSETHGAKVEFNWSDAEGDHRSLPLVDISSSGFSFALTEDLSGMTEGSEIPDVTLYFEDCEVRGEVVVLHITPETATRAVCGVLFYPASDDELVKLKNVIAGMESRQST